MHDVGCHETADLAEGLQARHLVGEEVVGRWHRKGLHEHACAGASCGETSHSGHALGCWLDLKDVMNARCLEPLQQQAGRAISPVHPLPLSTIEARSPTRKVLAADATASHLAIYSIHGEGDRLRSSGEAYAAESMAASSVPCSALL